MPQLVVVEGSLVGEVFQVDDETTLGASGDCAISLQDRRLAAVQARFELTTGGALVLRNLDPSTPLLVNSEVVEQAQIHHGDIVALGDTMMLFNEDPTDRSTTARKRRRRDTIRLRRSLDDSDHGAIAAAVGGRGKAARRLATLFNVANAIHEIESETELLSRLLELAFGVVPAERGAVLLADAQGHLEVAAHLTTRGRGGPAPLVSRTILQEVINTREAVLTTNAMDDDRFLSGMSIVEQNIQSAICAPLTVRDRLIGVIHLDSSSRRRSFDHDDLELVTGVALQAAGALENVRLFQRRQQHTDDLRRLSQVTRQLSSYLEKETIYREAVRIAGELVGATRVSLVRLLSAKGGPKLRIVGASGMETDDWKRIAVDDDGIVGEAIKTNQPQLRGELRPDDSQLIYEPNRERYSSDSFCVVPISSKGDVFDFETPAFAALCSTEKDDGSPFGDRDLQLLEILANQVGIALTNAELYERATVDGLTKVYVRRFFMLKLEEQVEACEREGGPVSLLMLDLDHFKAVNDNHGHQTGDVILRELGRLIRSKIRHETDIAARYGGEEFAVLLGDADLAFAEKMAQRIHRAIERFAFNRKRNTLSLTASIGVAQLAAGEQGDQLIKRADKALYRAKHEGRNQVVVAR